MPDPETERRLAALETRLRRLETQLARSQRTPEADGWLPVPQPQAAYPPPQALHSMPAPAPLPPRPAAAPRERSEAWEKLLGGNWLARAGVLVLALGVLFFLKLAYDNNWVPLAGRIAIGVLGGLSLFAAGELLRQRKFDATFSQIIAGGGALIAYATIYTAYALPNYRAALGLTAPVEVVLLACMAALLGGYALWRNLPVLAGVAVGLCALLVAPAGDFTGVGVLFMGLMGAALLAAAAVRGWGAVVLTSIVGLNLAHLVAALSDDVAWWLTLASAAVVDTLAVVAAARSKAASPEVPRVEAGLASGLLFAVAALALNAGNVGDATAWSALGVGAAAVLACLALPRVAPGLGLVGGLLLLGWPALHFTGLPQVVAWAGLAAAALAASLAGRASRWIRLEASAAVGLGVLALMALARFDAAAKLHPYQSGGLALILLGLAAATWATGRRDAKDVGGGMAGFGAACALLAAWPFLQFPANLLQTATLLLAGTALATLGLAWASRPEVRYAAAGLAAIGMWSLFGLSVRHGVARLEPIASGALAAGLLGLALGVWMATPRGAKRDPASIAGLAAGAVLVAVWPVLQFPDTLWQTVTYGLAGTALLAGAWAWRPGARELRVGATGAAVLGALSLWFLGASLGAIDLAPILSLLAAGLVLALACVLWATRRTGWDGVALGRVALAVAAITPLVELGHLLGGWGIPVSWAVEALAAVTLGLLLRSADIRIASLALFGLVVARIFLVDLSQLSLPARVLAFLLTGGLLLVGSFLYARQKKEEPTELVRVQRLP